MLWHHPRMYACSDITRECTHAVTSPENVRMLWHDPRMYACYDITRECTHAVTWPEMYVCCDITWGCTHAMTWPEDVRMLWHHLRMFVLVGANTIIIYKYYYKYYILYINTVRPSKHWNSKWRYLICVSLHT